MKELKTVYIAGPMTGYPGHNVPAFDAAADQLRAAGFAVVSPPDITRQLGTRVEGIGVDGSITPEAYRMLVREDLRALLECDAVALLPEWGRSQGAQLEYVVATRIGLPVYTLEALLSGQGPLSSVWFHVVPTLK